MTAPEPVKVSVKPEPTDDELAAILAAYRELWPDQPAAAPEVVSTAWRFSGRWWSHTPGRRRLH
ncbi:MAG: hypothetical protein ACR2PK_04440 [Acidimicrobiales bacterium]